MNKFIAMIEGPRQWTHPHLRGDVIDQYTELQRRNPNKKEDSLFNAAVEIVRLNNRVATREFKSKWGLA